MYDVNVQSLQVGVAMLSEAAAMAGAKNIVEQANGLINSAIKKLPETKKEGEDESTGSKEE